jgi:hypothetical protein
MEHQVPDTVTKTVYSPPPHKSGLVLFSFFQKRRLSLKAGPDLSLYIESLVMIPKIIVIPFPSASFRKSVTSKAFVCCVSFESLQTAGVAPKGLRQWLV